MLLAPGTYEILLFSVEDDGDVPCLAMGPVEGSSLERSVTPEGLAAPGQQAHSP